MRFYSALKGQLILIGPLKAAPQPPTMPLVAKSVVAKSVVKRQSLFNIIFWAICTMIGASGELIGSIFGRLYCANRPKLAVLTFLFWILVEILAEDYVSKVLGAM